MAKKIQKKQIEDGVFVETKSTYTPPTQDSEYVQKKYVDEEVAKKANVSHTHSWYDITDKPGVTNIPSAYTTEFRIGDMGSVIVPKLPSWVTDVKPSYNWSEIGNKPTYFDTNKLKYERITDIDGLLTESGVLKVADGENVINAPSNNWYHFLGGSHTNINKYSYYLAYRLDAHTNEFWYKQKVNGVYGSWYKFVGLGALNDNGLFREWNLPHGLSTYIGDSNAYAVRTKFSGQGGDLLFSLNTLEAFFSRAVKMPELLVDSDLNGNLVRFRSSGEDLVIGNSAFNDLRYLKTKGIKIWGNEDNNKVVLAGGGNKSLGAGQVQEIDLKGLPEDKYYLVYVEVDAGDRCKFRVHTSLDWKSKPSWSTHGGGFSMQLEFEQTGAGWGTTHPNIITRDYTYLHSNVQPAMYLFQLFQSGTVFVYLRGGGVYTIYSWSMSGSRKVWNNPRKTSGNFEINGQSTPYCLDWDASKEIIPITIRSDKNATYGAILKSDYPFLTSEVFLDNANSGSKTNLWTHNNELHIGSRSLGGYTKISCNGYKKIGSSGDHFLLGNGEHEHRKFLGRCGEVRENWTTTQSWFGQTINVLAQCDVDLRTLENNFNISFRKCFAGGQVTFTTTGRTVVFTGDNTFNGGDGSTCVVSAANNKLYIDVRNI